MFTASQEQKMFIKMLHTQQTITFIYIHIYIHIYTYTHTHIYIYISLQIVTIASLFPSLSLSPRTTISQEMFFVAHFYDRNQI